MPSDSTPRYNLERIDVLLVDETALGMTILAQVMKTLGVRRIHRSESVEAAKAIIQGHGPDFAIIDSLTDRKGFELVRWIRTETSAPTCYMPVLMTAGHTPQDDVAEAMSCGIDYLIKKPIAPRVLVERIAWISRNDRSFVYSDVYIGPERRGPKAGAPPAAGERRAQPIIIDGEGADEPSPPRQAGRAS